ncbi:MAG: hypothetical protein ABI316_05755 [Casimicrobiaceae bacterium]
MIPFVNPVTMNGEGTFTKIRHEAEQFCVSMEVPGMTHTQYSTPGSVSQLTVALVSSAATLKPVGAGEELPPPQPPIIAAMATIAIAKNSRISDPRGMKATESLSGV